jgi:hypothetical protein
MPLQWPQVAMSPVRATRFPSSKMVDDKAMTMPLVVVPSPCLTAALRMAALPAPLGIKQARRYLAHPLTTVSVGAYGRKNLCDAVSLLLGLHIVS